MSTPTSTLDRAVGPGAEPAPRAEAHPVTLRRVLASEWIKLRTLRSTRITLAVGLVLMAGIGVVVAAVIASRWNSLGADEQASFDPTYSAMQGHVFGQLAIGVLGVLVVTGEYATGMIRATLAAVPKRLPVLWAKSIVFGAVTLASSTIASFVAFFGAQAVLTPHHLQTTISASGVLRAVVGGGLYLTVVGLIGVTLGALVRNTAAAITTLFGVLLLLPVLIDLLPSSVSDHITKFLPSNAGDALLHVHQQSGTLAPWTGFAVMCAYAVAGLAAAAYLLKRRDA